MQTASGDANRMASASWNETNRTILSELVSVILQIRRSLEAIESEFAREMEPENEPVGDIVVLDDVTAGYARSCAVLRECDARLSAAVHLLLESMASGERTCDFVTAGRSPPAHVSF